MINKRTAILLLITLLIFVIACGTNTVTSPPLEDLAEGDTSSNVAQSNEPTLIILSSSDFEDNGWFHIVGEVQNESDTFMEYVKIVATLYNENGDVVGTDFTYTILDLIPPHGKAPFELGTDSYDGVTNYKLQAQGRASSNKTRDIEIISHNQVIDNGWFHVVGEVKNNGTSDADFVKIVITLYDAENVVVGTDFTYTELDIISPGGISPFESGTDHFPGLDHYEIQVQ